MNPEMAYYESAYYPESLTVLLAGMRAVRWHDGLEPGRLLRALRRGARVSQREVASRAGMRQARVSEIERHGERARWGEVQALLTALHCRPVLLAVSAAYTGRKPRPLARIRKFRYTDRRCSPA